MKAYQILLLILILSLVGCSPIQPEPVLTVTPIPADTFQPAATPEPSPISTPTIEPTDPASNLQVFSNDNQTYIGQFDWDVSALRWAQDGKTLLIGPQNRKLYIYDVVNKKITTTLIGDPLASPLVLGPGEKTIALILCNDVDYHIGDFCQTQDFSLYLVNLETNNIIKTFHITDKADAQNLIGSGWLIFSPDGKLLIAASSRQISLWDLAGNKTIKVLFQVDPKLVLHQSGWEISAVTLSPDGKWLIGAHSPDGSAKKTFMVWDTSTWKLQRTFSGGSLGSDFSLTFSPDGTRFTTSGGSEIHEPGTWDLKTGKLLYNLGPQRWVYTIAYDPSGKYFAAGGTGGGVGINKVTIYDANTGKPVRELLSQDFAISILAFSPDGTELAAGGGSDRPGGVIIWDLTQP